MRERFKQWNANRRRPIGGMPDLVKEIGSVFAFPVFPALHAVDDWKDFKKSWTTDEDGMPQSKAKTALDGVICAAVTAAWTHAAIGLLNATDGDATDHVHEDKIHAAVMELDCDLPEGQGMVVCGPGEVSATPHAKAWLPYSSEGIDGESFTVIKQRSVQPGFTLAGQPAYEVLRDLGILKSVLVMSHLNKENESVILRALASILFQKNVMLFILKDRGLNFLIEQMF